MEEIIEEKRIFSTVVLIVFLVLLCVACWFDIFLSVAITDMLKNLTPPESTGDGEMDLFLGGLIGVSIGMGAILAFVVSIVTALVALTCLGYSIRNTRVKNKPVRVINIVLSCCNAVAFALGITAIILLRVL